MNEIETKNVQTKRIDMFSSKVLPIDDFKTGLKEILSNTSTIAGNSQLKKVLTDMAECGNIERFNIVLDMAKDRISKSDMESAFYNAASAGKDKIIDCILKNEKNDISEGYLKDALRTAVKDRHDKIVSSLCDNALHKIPTKNMEDALVNSAFGDRNNIELLPNMSIANTILEKASTKISKDCVLSIINDIVLYNKDLIKASSIVDKLSGTNIYKDPAMRLFNSVVKGENREVDRILQTNKNLSGNEILLSLRSAELKGNTRAIGAILHEAKDKIMEDDIKLKDVLKEGDFFYGLGFERNVAIITNKGDTKNWTIDALNNQVIDSVNMSNYGKYSGIEAAKTEAAKQHFTYLEGHNKYNPKLVDGVGQTQRNIRINRACKGGIERIIHNKDGNRIFYILKGLDKIKALNKTADKRGFASAEFRKIFRETLKDPELADKRIVFVDNDEKFIKPTELFHSLEGRHTYVPKSLKMINRSANTHVEFPKTDKVDTKKKDLLLEKLRQGVKADKGNTDRFI